MQRGRAMSGTAAGWRRAGDREGSGDRLAVWKAPQATAAMRLVPRPTLTRTGGNLVRPILPAPS